MKYFYSVLKMMASVVLPAAVAIWSTGVMVRSLGPALIGPITFLIISIGVVSNFDFGIGRMIGRESVVNLMNGIPLIEIRASATYLQLLMGSCLAVIFIILYEIYFSKYNYSFVNILLFCMACMLSIWFSAIRYIWEAEGYFGRSAFWVSFINSFMYGTPLICMYYLIYDGRILTAILCMRIFIIILIILLYEKKSFLYLSKNFHAVAIKSSIIFKKNIWLGIYSLVAVFCGYVDKIFCNLFYSNINSASYNMSADFVQRFSLIPALATRVAGVYIDRDVYSGIGRGVLRRGFFASSIFFVVFLFLAMYSKWFFELWLGAQYSEASYSVARYLFVLVGTYGFSYFLTSFNTSLGFHKELAVIQIFCAFVLCAMLYMFARNNIQYIVYCLLIKSVIEVGLLGFLAFGFLPRSINLFFAISFSGVFLLVHEHFFVVDL